MSDLKFIPIDDWKVFDSGRPYVIAGPCSAESEDQLMKTAAGLKAAGISVFRAGIWKPRTHPGCFEGIGEPALKWLSAVAREYGMKVGTEVAGSRHVEACLKNGVDMVWIGARTSANPFLMQEIADALEGVDIPVLVKNPVCPDLNLWMGAIERLALKGVRKIGAVHRGCSTYEKLKYRNNPQWTLAIDLHLKFPEIPVFCDPSHMGGSAAYIRELSQRSVDLGFDGLMIESHCNPSAALSDASQQLVPEELAAVLASLTSGRKSERFEKSVAELREQIDIVDEELLKLLARRVEASRGIGRIKKEEGVNIVQPGRWKAVLNDADRTVEKLGLDPDFVNRIFSTIHENSIIEQLKIKEI